MGIVVLNQGGGEKRGAGKERIGPILCNAKSM